MRPGPALRVLFLVVSLAVAWLALAHGTFDHLSIMREYAVNAARFAHEARAARLLAGRIARRGARRRAAARHPLSPACRGCAARHPRHAQCHPDHSGDRPVRHPDGAAGTLAAAWPLAAALGIRGIGAAPAVVALFLYSLLPIVANTVAGLRRVSHTAVEAARGMGMTSAQVLTGIELPLALPVILTGVRVVLVQNIGMVTVAALIGGGGLGTFVFQGIGQTAIDLVLLGAIPIVALGFLRRGAARCAGGSHRSGAAMITIENLTKRYGATTVVDGVSMEIAGNSITVIVGTSGSGKSTLLRMINRLVEPSSGRVLIDGHDTRDEPAHLLRRRIGYAIQGHGLFPASHGRGEHRHRAAAARLGRRPHPRARRGAAAGLPARSGRSTQASSRISSPAASSSASGWRERWPRSRRVLLMDEPFGALDPIIRAKAQEDLLDDPAALRHDHRAGDARHGRSVPARRSRRGDEPGAACCSTTAPRCC